MMAKALLAVDTATESCGVCIVVDGRVRIELCLNHGQTHTRHVLQAIDAALSLSGLGLPDMDAFAVTSGPGSFTGLRIGISTMKGLAFAAAKQMVGISTLEVLARQAAGESNLICPMIDARRNEIYWRIFRRENEDLIPLTDEHVGPVDQLTGRIDGFCTFIGNGATLYAAQLDRLLGHRAQRAPEADNTIRPAVLGQLAWNRFQKGRFVDARTFIPVYLRKSDAELAGKQ